MSNVSKQIYRELEGLFTDLEHIEPFNRVNLSDKGFPDINLVVFESTPDIINFILGRYQNEGGRLIANPCFEITANPKMKIANAVTYKDTDYFHEAKLKPEEVGEMAQAQANRFLYGLLCGLKTGQQGVQAEKHKHACPAC